MSLEKVPVKAAGVPSGGSTGQVLSKNSNASNDVVWLNGSSGSSSGPINSIQKSNGVGGFIDSGLISNSTGLTIERVETNIKHVSKDLVSTNNIISGQKILVSSSEISDGESVIVKVLWSAKDDGLNSGAGGLFITGWTKHGGVLSKIFDNDTLKGSNSANGSLNCSTNQSSGNINIIINVPAAFNNYSVSWHAELLFRKAI